MFILTTTLSLIGLPFLTLAWLAHEAHRRGEDETARAVVGILWRLAIVSLLLVALAVGFVVIAGLALAYPEMARHGYDACSGCHVAPSGGGLLTGYGRSAGPTLHSTWALAGEEEPSLGLAPPAPDWLLVGGDVRTIAMRVSAGETVTTRAFPMQLEGELGLSPLPPLTVVASAGRYGEAGREEFRRAYVKLAHAFGASGWRLAGRAGRFMPAYGLEMVDHRLATRAGLGLGEGAETFAAEFTAANEDVGELALTRIVGSDLACELDERGGRLASDTPAGLAARAAIYLAGHGQLGVSALWRGDELAAAGERTIGAHLTLGVTEWLWGLAELDYRLASAEAEGFAVGMARVGVEPWRGVQLVAVASFADRLVTGGGQLAWLPRPHLEFVLEATRTLAAPDAIPVDALLLLSHFYL